MYKTCACGYLPIRAIFFQILLCVAIMLLILCKTLNSESIETDWLCFPPYRQYFSHLTAATDCFAYLIKSFFSISSTFRFNLFLSNSPLNATDIKSKAVIYLIEHKFICKVVVSRQDTKFYFVNIYSFKNLLIVHCNKMQIVIFER